MAFVVEKDEQTISTLDIQAGSALDLHSESDELDAMDKIVHFALEEAMKKLEQNGEVVPFTVVLHGDNLQIMNHPGEDAVECFNAATTAVRHMAHVMDAYVFAYEGYVNTDSGTRDALIAERGRPDSETAEAFAILYTLDEEGDGLLTFEEGLFDIGSASSLLHGARVTSDDLDEL